MTRAAEDLHLSQPAVSSQLKTLETAIGRPLFGLNELYPLRVDLDDVPGPEVRQKTIDLLESRRVVLAVLPVNNLEPLARVGVEKRQLALLGSHGSLAQRR